jgi:hypothetical protein
MNIIKKLIIRGALQINQMKLFIYYQHKSYFFRLIINILDKIDNIYYYEYLNN